MDYTKKIPLGFVMSFLLPNIIFICLAYYLHAVRLIINIDYILPCILLLSHNRFIRILGIVVLIFIMLIETHILLLKFFPFLDIAMAMDLLPFILIGPTRYLVLSIGLIFAILGTCILTWFLNRNQQQVYSIFVSIVIIILYIFAGILYELKYDESVERQDGILSTSPYYIHSQFDSYRNLITTDFARYMLQPAEIVPYKDFDNIGMNYIKKPYNDKILFIVAESFGVLKNKDVQKEIFAELYKNINNYEFVKHGVIRADSSTLAAEFRELCYKSIENGFDFSKTDNQKFSDCIPNKLNEQDYSTISLHGASSFMYKRRITYPKMGFKKSIFGENMLDKKQCHSFHGTCDSEIFSLVTQEFKNNDKAFVYWLTLTSHYPYSEKDIFNHRFDCNKYNIQEGPLCRNLQLQTQFIDQLTVFSMLPEMKGVEVFLVGDHPIPAISEVERDMTELTQVSFIHFKIKE